MPEEIENKLAKYDNYVQPPVKIKWSQRAFAEEYFKSGDLNKAYKVAYPDKVGTASEAVIRERAHGIMQGRGVRIALSQLQEQADLQLSRLVAWDRQKATKFLIKALNRIEENLDDIDKAKAAMQREGFKDWKVLKFVIEMTYLTSQSVKEVAKQLNDMYGLSLPEKVQNNALQIIIQSPHQLPDDVDEPEVP